MTLCQSQCVGKSPQSCSRKSDTKMSKYKIVMVRHGESEWNKLNLFCGWYDAELSEAGNYVWF